MGKSLTAKMTLRALVECMKSETESHLADGEKAAESAGADDFDSSMEISGELMLMLLERLELCMDALEAWKTVRLNDETGRWIVRDSMSAQALSEEALEDVELECDGTTGDKVK